MNKTNISGENRDRSMVTFYALHDVKIKIRFDSKQRLCIALHNATLTLNYEIILKNILKNVFVIFKANFKWCLGEAWSDQLTLIGV